MSKHLRRKKHKHKYLNSGDLIYNHSSSTGNWTTYEIVNIYKFIYHQTVKIDIRKPNNNLAFIFREIDSNDLYLKPDLNTQITDNCFNLKSSKK